MKAGIYLRVSKGSQTTDNQRRELAAYCERQGWTVAGIYDDSGVSGAKADRPGLNRMMRDLAAKKIGLVACWKIDRLARSVADLLRLLQEIQQAGGAFVAITQQIDTSSAYGKMVVTFLGAIAEFERSLIVERVHAGLERARAEGIRLGRPRREFDAEKALEMKRDGRSWSEISASLQVSRATLRRLVAPLLAARTA